VGEISHQITDFSLRGSAAKHPIFSLSPCILGGGGRQEDEDLEIPPIEHVYVFYRYDPVGNLCILGIFILYVVFIRATVASIETHPLSTCASHIFTYVSSELGNGNSFFLNLIFR
jgi:hypothetical protein